MSECSKTPSASEIAHETLRAELTRLREQVAALRQQCDTLGHMLQAAPAFLYVYDLVEQRIVFENGGLTAMLGYSHVVGVQRMEAGELLQLMHPDDQVQFPEHMARVAHQSDMQGCEFAYRVQHTDGSWQRVVGRNRVFLRQDDGTPRQIIGVMQQRGAEPPAQDALCHHQALVQDMVAQAPLAIFARDLEGRYVVLNGQTTALFGQEAGIGKTAAEFLPPTVAEALQTDDEQVISTGQRVIREELVLPARGAHRYTLSTFPIRDAQGDLYAIGGMAIPITQHRQLEEQLRLWQLILDNAGDAIFLIDSRGRFTYVNKAACTSLGYTHEELLTLSLADVDRTMPIERWAHIWTVIQQQGTITFETNHWRKDGSIFPIEGISTYLNIGTAEYVYGFARDVTERKQAEAERTALQQQIIEAQQVALRELSTPIIPISDKVLIMPLIGSIDSRRAQQVLETLLDGVAAQRAETVIIDITGVQMVDTQVANALFRAAQAVRLLGARVILTGIQPRIAHTLVQLGVDLRQVDTRGTLQAGIAAALRWGGGSSE